MRVFREAFRSPDLRRRILFVLGIVVIYRFLSYVPVPVPDNAALAQFLERLFNSSQLLGFANLFTGGSLGNFSIVMMSLGPYINASIVMQLFTKIIPSLEALSKEGESGQRKIIQYTRLLTLPFAILQAIGMVILIRQSSIQIAQTDLIGNPDLAQWFLMITVMTAGSMLLMWLGELITEKGVGNGISIIILASIVSTLPGTFGQSLDLAANDSTKIIQIILFAAGALAVIMAMVYLNEGQRSIPVSYARRARDNRIYSGVDTHLPIRLITAGVIPIIFALAFLAVPPFLGQLLSGASTPWVAGFAQWLTTTFATTNPWYAAAYFGLVVVFTFFYTSIVFNAKDIAERIQKQGGFIPGIRPGNETAKYLANVVNRLTLTGAVALGLIAILPFVVERLTNTQSLTIGGTSLLIIVSVALETMKQIESRLIQTSYDGYNVR
ncbi:preprotein translocase subunit SecY [Patescibacteria group bacterium]|nr:MAG: preprotein translocase subunit SecY [Patescibacteria group bacterium]